MCSYVSDNELSYCVVKAVVTSLAEIAWLTDKISGAENVPANAFYRLSVCSIIPTEIDLTAIVRDQSALDSLRSCFQKILLLFFSFCLSSVSFGCRQHSVRNFY